MAKLLTAVFAALLLCGTAQALDIAQFLNDPKYLPFLQKAIGTGTCLSDPAVSSGALDLDKCPSLLGMLEAVNGGATDYPVECEPECMESFYSLSPECLTPLTQEFNADASPIGVLGSRFLAECAALKESGGAGAPAPAPAANDTDMDMPM